MLGGVVIDFGVTFISFLVAIVTSLFVEANRVDDKEARDAQHEETQVLYGRSPPGCAPSKRVSARRRTPIAP